MQSKRQFKKESKDGKKECKVRVKLTETARCDWWDVRVENITEKTLAFKYEAIDFNTQLGIKNCDEYFDKTAQGVEKFQWPA
jgi:hypothetical protein